MAETREERYALNCDLAKMLKGGVIMDVTNVEEAQIAQEAGAVAVMALERVPSDIRKQGGVARMSDPEMIVAIKKAVSIPVMAKARIGHIIEARVLESLEIDYIDESEVLLRPMISTILIKNVRALCLRYRTWGRLFAELVKAR